MTEIIHVEDIHQLSSEGIVGRATGSEGFHPQGSGAEPICR
jgi:hypothetical protein